MHGSTGGDWKRRQLATDSEKNSCGENPVAPLALRPTARHGHRASPRPYTPELILAASDKGKGAPTCENRGI